MIVGLILAAKAEHEKTCDQQAAAPERWIEQEKVLELERETERVRLELEKKKKEEEEKERKLAKVAKKKATAVVEVLIDDRRGCDMCMWIGKSLFVSCEEYPLLIAWFRGCRVLSCQQWSWCGVFVMPQDQEAL